jgi:copper chaperone NosL
MKRLLLLSVLPLVLLAGCKEDQAAAPQPVAMTDEALGHYCQMNLTEHAGPKAQVHLAGAPAPLFFSQVRDAISYQRMPEQSHAITAIYVNDMARAPSWENPGKENWIAAEDAHFVVGSQRVGGMGATELVPFSDPRAAADFADLHGGRVLRLAEIADDAVLAPEDKPAAAPETQDYRERLRQLSAGREG